MWMSRYKTVLAVAAVFWTAGVCAVEIEPEWREPVNRVASLVADLSAGELEAGWQKFRVMLPEPPLTPKTPFEPDPFEYFQKEMARFPRGVDSLSLIAERRYSANSRRLYFLAEGKHGPTLIEVLAFRHRDEWFFNHFGFQQLCFADANWHKQHEDVLPLTKLSEPAAVSLPQPPVAEQVSQP
jgi:hypothetical protein